MFGRKPDRHGTLRLLSHGDFVDGISAAFGPAPQWQPGDPPLRTVVVRSVTTGKRSIFGSYDLLASIGSSFAWDWPRIRSFKAAIE